ncbi:MAG: glycosyltransferase family 2 protein, partial [Clostridia bacterium]|nr:glycosyltransferase family 2 protein [Clostridia bacterium]
LFDDEKLDELLKLKMHCLYYKECDFVDVNLSNYDIECIKKTTADDKDYDKIEFIDYKIGIIIPNCNYEHTIEKCLTSIFNQTYKNFEIVFIDDMSTDNSVQIAKETYNKFLMRDLAYMDGYSELPSMPPQLKIVQLQQKRLNGGARNEAYLHLSKDVDYVYYVDSDDWLYDEHALEKINRKLQTKPDVLFVGMASYKNDKLNTCFIPQYKDKYEAFSGWSGSCGKAIKKSLATRQECLYNEGTLKEDKNQHCKICFYMKDFALLQEPIYVWNQMNSKSITTIREKVVWGTSTIRHYADTLQLALSIKGQDAKIDRLMEERVRKTKFEMEQNGDRQW